MATNLNLDAALAEIKALPSHSPQWAPKVTALLRRLFHSASNPWGPNVRRDSLLDGAGLPVGSMMAFADDGENRGFVRCDGRSLSRTTYAALFKVVGTRFGAANSGVFSVPNLARRMVIGRSEDFPVGTYAGREVGLLSINEMPEHRHGTSGMTVSERPAHGHSSSYVYGKDEFPAIGAKDVAVIAPSPNLHGVPTGGWWPFVDGNPYDFPKARTNPDSRQYAECGSDGAHGHQMRGAVTGATGGGEEISLMGPSVCQEWHIYTGVL